MVGNRIRELRQARGISLTSFARMTDLSPGLISQVERGLTDPSLETLRRVSRALDVPLFSLFNEVERESVAVVRRGKRVQVRSPHGGITYARLSPGAGKLELLEGTLGPWGVSSETPWSHPSEECVVVLGGRLVVEVEEESYDLEAGDSCYFDSRRPHRYRNPAEEPVTFIVAVTPPSY